MKTLVGIINFKYCYYKNEFKYNNFKYYNNNRDI